MDKNDENEVVMIRNKAIIKQIRQEMLKPIDEEKARKGYEKLERLFKPIIKE